MYKLPHLYYSIYNFLLQICSKLEFSTLYIKFICYTNNIIFKATYLRITNSFFKNDYKWLCMEVLLNTNPSNANYKY